MIIRRSVGARSNFVLLLVLLAAAPTPATAAANAVATPAGKRPPENPFEELAAIEEARLDASAGRAEAVGPLLGLLELAQVLPPGRFDAVVRRLVDRAADPLVAGRARDWLARRTEEQGDETQAAKLREPLGLLTRFWVIGPFGDGRASVGVPYPPESEGEGPDVARPYPGKERNVSWRRADGAIRRGALDLSALLRPDTQAAAYALAFVRVDRATDAALRLGTPGPVKVWCNGALVHSADQVRSARFDQDAVGVRFRPGWNRLLIKTVVTVGTWRLFARLTAPDGGAFPFTCDWEASASAAPTSSRRSARDAAPRAVEKPAQVPAQVKVRALEPVLRERVRVARTPEAAAQAGVDLGRYLLMVDPADRDRKEAARAFEAAAARHATVPVLMGLANAGREEDESRRALERALGVAKTPRDRARVLAALGDVARDQRREAVAVERWRAALAADERWWPATLSLAGEEQSAGFPGAALARIDRLPADILGLSIVARERARLLMALGRRAEAAGVWGTLRTNARDDLDLLRDLGAAARDRGDGAESLGLLERAAALRPDLGSTAVDWARALEGARDLDRARDVLETAARRLPHEPTLAAELGKLLDRMGQTAGAAEWLRTALDLRPQDPELRRYADGLGARLSAGSGDRGPGGGSRGDLPRRFAAPIPPLLGAELARAASASARAPTNAPINTPTNTSTKKGEPAKTSDPDPAVVLLDRRAVRVHPNGLSEVFAQRVVEVRTDGGARDNKEFLVRYTPGAEEVEILEARIFRRGPGGALDVLQASERDDQDLSEPWYGLYYDYRAEVVRFEGLRAGDVLEVQYLVSDVSRGNELSGYFGDLQFIAEAIPKRRWDYTLLAPRTRDFHFARPAVAGLDETTTMSDDGQERVTRFSAADVPRIELEPAMPGIGEVSPYLHVSTYGSWDEVGTWYWRLVEEQLAPDDTIRRAAETAIQSAEAALRTNRTTPTAVRALTVEDKVRALHALVVGGTRYVGLEFGIHGFKPYKVSQVLARKFGDCKDKAALLVALLAQVGIDAEMVLLRTKRGGRIAPAPASLAVFDHAIVYVPKLGLYLDGTAEFSGMKELPGQDQGAMVLRVGPRGTKLIETPVLPSADNRARRLWNVRLKADGGAEVEEHLGIEGQAAPDWRSHYQTPGERMDRYAKVWTGRHPGARLEAVEMFGIDDRNRSVMVNAKASVPRLAEITLDGGLLLMLGARDADLVRTYARLSNRRLDLVLAYPWRHEEVITYQLPAGYRAISLPKDRRIENRFGTFDLRVGRQGAGVVVAETRLDVGRDRISAADYDEFRRFLADVDSAMSERIVLERMRQDEK